MRTVYPNLQAAMSDEGVSVHDLSELLGKSEEIVKLKLMGIRDWSLNEAVTICRYLLHPDLRVLFLR